MIYFIQAGKNGPIKIGHTNNKVSNRMASMQVGCPYELRLLWTLNGDIKDEFNLHEMFKHERIRGEWFHPSKDLVDYINETPNIYVLRGKDQETEYYETRFKLKLEIPKLSFKCVIDKKTGNVVLTINKTEIPIDPKGI